MNSQRVQGGGLWSSTRPNVSAETQSLLKVMMQESKLTSFQKRTLNSSIKNGESLPTKIGPTFSIVDKKPEPPKPQRKTVDPREYKNGLRKFEHIVESGAYEKSDYRPVMKKAITDDDKERLSKIMAYGKDATKWPAKKVVEIPDDYEDIPEPDRFDELQNEIKERAEFLETMSKLGKRKEYQAIILTEISQKIREMELIDKTRITELEQLKQLRNNL